MKETLRVKSIPALPEGFDLLYGCKNHPERVAVAPIALRMCRECHDEARRNYAAMIEREPNWLPSQDRTPWGDPINERKPKREKERKL